MSTAGRTCTQVALRPGASASIAVQFNRGRLPLGAERHEPLRISDRVGKRLLAIGVHSAAPWPRRLWWRLVHQLARLLLGVIYIMPHLLAIPLVIGGVILGPFMMIQMVRWNIPAVVATIAFFVIPPGLMLLIGLVLAPFAKLRAVLERSLHM